jgi:hypothetical protein
LEIFHAPLDMTVDSIFPGLCLSLMGVGGVAKASKNDDVYYLFFDFFMFPFQKTYKIDQEIRDHYLGKDNKKHNMKLLRYMKSLC